MEEDQDATSKHEDVEMGESANPGVDPKDATMSDDKGASKDGTVDKSMPEQAGVEDPPKPKRKRTPKGESVESAGSKPEKRAKVKSSETKDPPKTEDKGETGDAPDSARIVKTFARRYQPSKPFAKAKWCAIKNAFDRSIRPLVASTTKHEDFLNLKLAGG